MKTERENILGRSIHLLAAACAVLLLTAVMAPKDTHQAPVSVAPGDKLFFEFEVRDPDGELISRPRVMGEAGRPLRVEYQSGLHSEPDPSGASMCILLDPMGTQDGLDMSIDLTVEGLVKNYRKRLRLKVGERRFIEVPTDDGRTLDIGLLAYRVDSKAFERYLDTLREKVAGTPQA